MKHKQSNLFQQMNLYLNMINPNMLYIKTLKHQIRKKKKKKNLNQKMKMDNNKYLKQKINQEAFVNIKEKLESIDIDIKNDKNSINLVKEELKKLVCC